MPARRSRQLSARSFRVRNGWSIARLPCACARSFEPLRSMIMKSAVTFAVTLLAAGTTGCNKTESVKAATAQEATSEAAADKVADATVTVWKSMDASKIKALYAPSVEAFDFGVPGLAKDRAEFDKRQDAY